MIENATSKQKYIIERIRHWNSIAKQENPVWSKYYHQYIERLYQHIVPPKLKVLEIGCGNGDLLASLDPAEGIGIDQSETMVDLARKRHPDLDINLGRGEDVELEGTFDIIILSDLLNDIWDVQELICHLKRYCDDSTRIIINIYSRLWQPVLNLARKFGLANPMLPQNWLTVEDLKNLLYLEGLDTVKSYSEMVFPLKIPILTHLANRYLSKIFPFRYLCLTNILIARKMPENDLSPEKTSVSVVIAARNEEGNIADIFKRTPEMGVDTELIFVEGGSTDDTYEVIQQEIQNNPDRRAFVYKQEGQGKGDAVRLGFKLATGDILMILDADMTVPPENLTLFYDALVSGKGELINGVRLVYPMESEAMRFFNLIGNKMFSLAFTWLIGQSIKDTLCGTKVITRSNYNKIDSNRAYFGDFDPFGDFDLIFGAAKLNLKIVDLPIRYRDRLYGTTNISRWRHGLLLLRMVVFAASKIKFY